MGSLERVNSIHMKVLDPLLKWRILDLERMRGVSQYEYSKKNFQKVVCKLEKSNLIKSIIDPWSRRKFVYLTKFGAGIIDGTFYYPEMNKETIFHDAKVSETVNSLMTKNCFNSFLLEHEINETREIGKSVGEIPDALLNGENRGLKFKLALELELTRKSKMRIIAKVKRYIATGYYDYIMYLFCSEAIFKGYKKVLEEEFGLEVFKRVMLFNNDTVLSTKFQINKSRGWFNGSEVSLEDIFK